LRLVTDELPENSPKRSASGRSWFIADSSLRVYDGSQNVREEERHVTAEPEPSRAAEPQEQSSRGPRLGLIIALAIFAGVVIVIIYGYLERPGWVGSSGKQFWDYLELLIVPAALALGVYWLNRRQNERAQQAADAQQERALAVERQRAQDEALQAYLDQMAHLLIEHPLRRASPGDNLSTVARARTLTVLGRLDSARKRNVLQFLLESGLIFERRYIVSLQQADLSGADLSQADLSEASLGGVNLREANLGGASLGGANLHRTDLREANLIRANLGNASLIRANLMGADLKEAIMREASLGRANLYRTDLREANLIRANLGNASLIGANLGNAILISADLSGASLGGANLREANLTRAELREADLGGADLSEANLLEAKGVTNEQLSAARSLEGATTPNGQKYEDWLKDREGRGEDGENSGPS
jgi:uncharacterized protein YjbI with pentapeptide repeats